MLKRLIRGLGPGMLILLLTALHAAAAPVPPFSPYGTVKVNGANVPSGAEVSAWCGGVRYRSTQATIYEGESWYFNLDVPGDDPETPGKDGCYPGETVSFMIDDLTANETAAWSASSPQLDLTAERPLRYLYLPLVIRG
jgi:hypothetical protein